MKLRNVFILLLFASLSSNAQYLMGNSLYSTWTPITLSSDNINVPVNYNHNSVITIKGMYNAEPDAYVAIFSLSQEGEEENEANKLMNARIESIKAGLKAYNPKIELDIDIISFVPLYDQILEKKVFSKDSYVEKPVGFELKKNIIIEFKNSKDLNEIFSICAANQVYDYIRTDAVVSDMGKVKAQLRNSADSMVELQLKRYAKLQNIDLNDYYRTMSEGYTVVYPGEKYQNYTAFSCTSYFTKKFNLNNDANKKVTKHYMPIMNKEFDFVVNPVISIPTIQVLYQINLALVKKPEVRAVVAPQPQPKKEVFIITPSGELKQINL
jgi:hypothetical protein